MLRCKPLDQTPSRRRPVGKTSLIYRRTGLLRALHLLLSHTQVDRAVRYPEIELSDALAAAEQLQIKDSCECISAALGCRPRPSGRGRFSPNEPARDPHFYCPIGRLVHL
jgi:hypothetical protein